MIPSNYQLEFRHLRYFLAVAEKLHYRKAADSLYISQPGLSRQIKQLEDNLNIQLFKRHNRKVELTTAGQYLQKEITLLFKELGNKIHQAKLLEKGIVGNLRFGYVGSAMQEVIPQLLLKIESKYPNLIFDLKEMNNPKQIESLLNEDIDVGFVRMDKVPKGLSIKPILEETFSLVLPKNHKINEGNFTNLKQLKNERFILFDATYSQSYYEKMMQLFDDSGFTPITSHNTVHASSIYSLVENNLGVSIVPTSLKKGYDKNVKFIELKNIKQKTTLSIVWNSKNKTPVLENVLKLISALSSE
ncbi:MAG: LysR family transcriptional regulator [Vicingus serpentipes]|nr:LysR family transcriptional regulator [Vicingus serpentipes]